MPPSNGRRQPIFRNNLTNYFMKTIAYTGQVLSAANNQPLNKVEILIINTLEITHQYRAYTDETGSFSLELEPGTYDLHFMNEFDMPTIIAGVSLEQNLTQSIQLQVAGLNAKKIIGKINLSDNTVCSGYFIELLTGDTSKILAKTNCDEKGNFKFDNCESGYYLIRVNKEKSESYTIPLPKPEKSVKIHLNLTKKRIIDTVKTFAQPESKTTSGSFNVCKRSYRNFLFTGGAIYVDSSNMSINGSPFTVKISVAKNSSGYFAYSVNVDCRKSPFGVTAPDQAQYYFTDQTNDTYSLFCMWPTLHTVSYNSTAPTIIKVTIQGLGVGNYWENAASC